MNNNDKDRKGLPYPESRELWDDFRKTDNTKPGRRLLSISRPFGRSYYIPFGRPDFLRNAINELIDSGAIESIIKSNLFNEYDKDGKCGACDKKHYLCSTCRLDQGDPRCNFYKPVLRRKG